MDRREIVRKMRRVIKMINKVARRRLRIRIILINLENKMIL